MSAAMSLELGIPHYNSHIRLFHIVNKTTSKNTKNAIIFIDLLDYLYTHVETNNVINIFNK